MKISKIFMMWLTLVLLAMVITGCGKNKAASATETIVGAEKGSAGTSSDASSDTEVSTGAGGTSGANGELGANGESGANGVSDSDGSGVASKDAIPDDAEVNRVFGQLVTDYVEMIKAGPDSDAIVDGSSGVSEAIAWGASSEGIHAEEVLGSIGYGYLDVNSDTVPEIIIGTIDSQEGGKCYGSSILALYTCYEGRANCVVEGWARNRYALLDDMSIYNSGSNGAMYTIFGQYEVAKDRSELKCKDYYFSYETDEDASVVGYYHNTTGEWDKKASEKMDISDEAFGKLSADLEARMISVELTPFSTVEGDSVVEVSDGEGHSDTMNASSGISKVDVGWAADLISWHPKYDVFTADKSEYQTQIMLTTSYSVSEFKFLGLTFKDVDEDGRIIFDTEVLYSSEELRAERPLLVKMTFWGDTPSYGFSYIDESGTTKYFAISESGYDGSLELSSFEVE